MIPFARCRHSSFRFFRISDVWIKPKTETPTTARAQTLYQWCHNTSITVVQPSLPRIRQFITEWVDLVRFRSKRKYAKFSKICQAKRRCFRKIVRKSVRFVTLVTQFIVRCVTQSLGLTTGSFEVSINMKRSLRSWSRDNYRENVRSLGL